MSDRKVWVRNASGGESKRVTYAGMDYDFPPSKAILVAEDLGRHAQNLCAPQLEIVTEEQARDFNGPAVPTEAEQKEQDAAREAAYADDGAPPKRRASRKGRKK